jgi:hypothetical protein
MKQMQTSLGSKPLTSGGLHDQEAIGLQNVTCTIQPIGPHTIQPIGPHTIQPAGLLMFFYCSLFEQSNAEVAHILSYFFLGKTVFLSN